MPHAQTFRPRQGVLPSRDEIPSEYTWDLTAICRNWDEWSALLARLDAAIEEFKALQGTLSGGADRLLAAFQQLDAMGADSYRVWYYASLQYDQDQRDNAANARRQQVQILFARQQQAGAWFHPEMLSIPIDTVRGWVEANPELAV